jgi:hypothetical protein
VAVLDPNDPAWQAYITDKLEGFEKYRQQKQLVDRSSKSARHEMATARGRASCLEPACPTGRDSLVSLGLVWVGIWGWTLV